MGLGDEVLSLGEAQQLAKTSGLQVRIVGADGKPRWHPAWAGQRGIVQPGQLPRRCAQLINGPNARPYIHKWETWNGKPMIVFSSWRARDHKAEYELQDPTDEATSKYEGSWVAGMEPYVIVEHRVFLSSSRNKAFPSEKMGEVLGGLRDLGLKFTHVIPRGGGELIGQSEMDSVQQLMRFMSRAAGYIGIEGGLHHAAAALGKPAVVIFGGFVDPERTGYSGHVNLTGDNDGHACGRWAPCPHCRKAMASITPKDVLEAAKRVFLQEVS